MADQIRLNAFVLYGNGHIQHETWTHPPDRSATSNTIECWQHLRSDC
jgi:hypothetical protein